MNEPTIPPATAGSDASAPAAAPTDSRREFIHNQVFISYKTRQHGDYVESIADVLEAEGLEVWFDRRRRVPPWQAYGLDYLIKKGLNQSDSLLFLAPRPDEHRADMVQRLREHVDFALTGLFMSFGLSAGFWYGMWYRVLFGRNIIRSPLHLLNHSRESWQQWEERVSTELGLGIIRVVVADPGKNAPAADPSGHTIRVESMREDLLQTVVPILKERRRVPPQLKADVRKLVRLSLISLGFVLGSVATLAIVLLTVLLWLLVRAIV